MTQEKVLRTLQNLGLTQGDAQVYVFLGKKGPQRAHDIAKALRMPKQQVYAIIKNLEGKGIVNSSLERPARFSAIRFEKALDLFIKEKMEEAQRIKQNKTEILSDWRSIAIGESGPQPAKFTVFEGRNYIYSKLEQMVEETKNQLLIIATISGLTLADQYGLLEVAFSHGLRSKAQFRFLTELSSQNVERMKKILERKPKAGFRFEGRIPDLSLKFFSRIVIRDGEEAAFIISPGIPAEQDDLCLWTNCKSLVDSFTAVFEELWRNSNDIEKKIAEIETGTQMPKTHVISDSETAYGKYHEAMHLAKKEIMMFTSSEGLVACWQCMSLMRELAQRGVKVRIMAPVTSENLEAAHQLLNCCEVRQGPAGYLGTTIIDGQQLFQFKNPPPEIEVPQPTPYFENTFYTNDLEHIEKSKKMLDDFWKNASALSATSK